MPDTAPALTLIATDVDHRDEASALRTRIVDLEDLLTLVEASSGDDGNIRRLLRQCLADCRGRLRIVERETPA